MYQIPKPVIKSDDPDHLIQLINEAKAADFLGYTVRALQNWRLRGGGPKFVKVSARSIRYRRRDLIEWSEGLLRSHTSDQGNEAAQCRFPFPSPFQGI